MSALSPIIRELQQALGAEAVLWAPEDLIVYEYDGTIDRALPDAVAFPASTAQVVETLRIARAHGVPVTPRGAGTGLSGGALAIKGGVLVALNRMRGILEIDTANRTALVEPGVVNLDLAWAAEAHGLTYAPDPSSQRACTIGGNVAENAGGPHTLAYGTTTNHVLALEFVAADGTVHWLDRPARDAPGYDLVGCLVGSEGTMGIVTLALLRLVPLPESVRTFLAIYDSVRAASSAVSAIVKAGVVPAALEMIDQMTIRAVEPILHTGFPLDAEAVLIVEVDGAYNQVEAESEMVDGVLRQFNPCEIRTATDPDDRENLWKWRKGAISALGHIQPNYYLLDGVVPRTRLPDVLDKVYAIADRYGLPVANVFHAGDGNLHPCLCSTSASRARPNVCWTPEARSCAPASTRAARSRASTAWATRSGRICPGSSATPKAMQQLRTAFGADEDFNPCKIFPTGHGCGEAGGSQAQRQIARFGPDAYV